MQELITYVRNDHGDPTAVLVAQKVDSNGTIRIGWSACHKEDKNNGKKFFLNIARHRLLTGTNKIIPYRIQKVMPTFKDRCRKYFRSDCIIAVGE